MLTGWLHAVAVMLMLTTAALAQSELWKCPKADGSVLFSDRSGPGCRKIEAPPLPSSRPVQSPTVNELQESTGVERPASPPRRAVVLSSTPFAPATRSVPSLAVRDLSPKLKAQGFSLPNKGDITIVQLDVSHLPAGDGPKLAADFHFQGGAQQALSSAVSAAAKAVQYDPKFLSVQLTMPAAIMFDHGQQIDGPSAGVAWTVAIVSALLGDVVRSDVCLSGTMGPDLKVGPVGGLEYKIEGCHMMPHFRELILPAGQNTFTITDKGMARSMKVTEVSTLAEAYQAATGQTLRPAQ